MLGLEYLEYLENNKLAKTITIKKDRNQSSKEFSKYHDCQLKEDGNCNYIFQKKVVHGIFWLGKTPEGQPSLFLFCPYHMLQYTFQSVNNEMSKMDCNEGVAP